ncbi:hypothetical protein EV401DRAFT_2141170 [Pisolithus croceorrhizus]|nr:hypothetical protein EV401DRAFT_2141170 [Pisolithus croceorrhizus]
MLFYQTVPILLVLKIRNLRTSRKMFNYLATKFQDPTPISVPTEKPIEASSDNKTRESCMKPNKLSLEPPSEERLEDKLTETRSKGEAEAAVGAAQQTPSRSVKFEEYVPEVPSNLCTAWNELYEQPNSRAGGPLKSKHIKVLNGMVEVPDEVENVDEMAHEDLPLKPCDRSTTNNFPSARGLLLEGEQAVCMSSSPRNLNGIENEQLRLINSHYPEEPQLTVYDPGSTLQQPMAHSQEAEMDKGGCQVLLEGELADYGSRGQEEPIDLPVKLVGHNGSMKTTRNEWQNIRAAQTKPIIQDSPVSSQQLTSTRSHSYEAVKPRCRRGRIIFEAGNISRRQEDKEAYQSCNNAIPHPRKGIGTPTNLTVEYRTLKECPEGIRSQRSVDMNPPSQTRGPGGQVKVNKMFGDVEDERKHQNNREQVGMDGKWCQMDGQHKWQKHKPIDVPEPPTPLGIHLGRPTKPVNEPRQRGKLKSQSRSVRHSRGTRKDLPCYQIESRMKGAIPSREKPCGRPREAVYKNPGRETRRWGVRSQSKATVHARRTGHKHDATFQIR